jgi:LacI family transcriptional regulator
LSSELTIDERITRENSDGRGQEESTDNYKLIKLARDHLTEAGLRRFAMFSLPEAQEKRWAQERESAFGSLMLED